MNVFFYSCSSRRWSVGVVDASNAGKVFAASSRNHRPRAPAAAAAPACIASAPSPKSGLDGGGDIHPSAGHGELYQRRAGRYCAAGIGAGAREALRRFTSIQIYEKAILKSVSFMFDFLRLPFSSPSSSSCMFCF